MSKSALLIAGAMLTLGVVSASHAQTVDMSKFTCQEMLTGTADSTETAIWLSGYYNGMHKNTKLNLGQFKHNAEVVMDECRSNPKKTVMQAVDKLLSHIK